MNTQLYDEGAIFRIVNNGHTILIGKTQIRQVETVGDKVVLMDIGNGPLKNIYLRLSDVNVPNRFSSAGLLRDAIKSMWQNGYYGVPPEVQLQEQLTMLGEIKQLLTDIKTALAPAPPPAP